MLSKPTWLRGKTVLGGADAGLVAVAILELMGREPGNDGELEEVMMS